MSAFLEASDFLCACDGLLPYVAVCFSRVASTSSVSPVPVDDAVAPAAVEDDADALIGIGIAVTVLLSLSPRFPDAADVEAPLVESLSDFCGDPDVDAEAFEFKDSDDFFDVADLLLLLDPLRALNQDGMTCGPSSGRSYG